MGVGGDGCRRGTDGQLGRDRQRRDSSKARRAGRKRRGRRGLLARDPAGVHARPHHHQPEQRRLSARARASCTRRSSATWTSRTRRPCTTCGRSSSRTSRACAGSSRREFGCDPEELAITRNASEALQIAQLGIDLKPGDEVVTTNQDYRRMLDTWEQRVRRDGIKLTKISFPVPPRARPIWRIG